MEVRMPAEQTNLIHGCGCKADIWKEKHLISGSPERHPVPGSLRR